MEPGDAARAAAAAGDYGLVIRLYRQERGLSQGQLGGACGYSQPAISRLERGLRTYDLSTLRGVAHALDIPLHLFGLAEPALVNRRDFLAGTAMAIATTKLPRVPAEAVDYFTSQLAAHWQADRAIGPHLLIDTVAQQCRTVLRAVASTRGELHAHLLQVATAYTGLAGWLYQDAGDLAACSRWLSETLELAHRSGDPELVAYALTSKAMVRADAGDGVGAVDLAEAALTSAPQLGAKAKAMAVQQAAIGHALIGDRPAVDRCLDDMAGLLTSIEHRHFGGDRLDNDPAVVVARHRATCYGRMGMGAEAAALWAHAGVSLDHRDAGVYLARYATALLDAHRPDDAVGLAAEGLGYLRETGSARMRDELHLLRNKAITWQTTAAGRDLIDVLTTA